MSVISRSPFNSHFFSQLALPNGRAGERNERVDGHCGISGINHEWTNKLMKLIWFVKEWLVTRPFHSTSIQKKLLIWLVELELFDGWVGVGWFAEWVGYGPHSAQWLRPRKQTSTNNTNNSNQTKKRQMNEQTKIKSNEFTK